MRIPLTPYGRHEILLYGGHALALTILACIAAYVMRNPYLWAAAALPAGVLLFALQFFRDPERRVPGGPETIVSPADGTVVDIVDVDEPEYIRGPARRIGIFMSPFDCHVNRFPVDGVVERVIHRAGKYLRAYDARAIAENEASLTGIRARLPGGREVPILLRQVAGVAARRIVNPLARGDRARRGELFGMIKFGSRCEVFLPRDLEVEVTSKLGERVAAGESAIARVPAIPLGASAGAGVASEARS
jgi:phosphatidylserine decarboxylase